METQAEPTRTRSPAYPGIGIEEALILAKKLYDAEDQRFANIEAVAAHWDLSPKNSNFQVSLAALKHFGLLVDEGSKDSRRLKLTDLAMDILHYPSRSEKWLASVQAAALYPKIHRELWDMYGGKLPPDVSIRLYLLREREDGRFNKNYVDGFITRFRETMAFAGLTRSDKIPSADEECKPDREPVMVKSSNPQADERPTTPIIALSATAGTFLPAYTCPVSASNIAEIRYQRPFSPEEFEIFKMYVELLGKSMVQPNPKPSPQINVAQTPPLGSDRSK
jgi:hypothetical protein